MKWTVALSACCVVLLAANIALIHQNSQLKAQLSLPPPVMEAAAGTLVPDLRGVDLEGKPVEAELLRKAVASAQEHPTKPRRIQIRTRDRRITRVSGQRQNDALETMFVAAHYDWVDPLSAKAHQDWRDQLAENRCILIPVVTRQCAEPADLRLGFGATHVR